METQLFPILLSLAAGFIVSSTYIWARSRSATKASPGHDATYSSASQIGRSEIAFPSAAKDSDNVSLTSDDSNRQWREQVHAAVDETGAKHQDFYELFDGNSSFDSLNDLSYAQTPERYTLDVVETNSDGVKRKVQVTHRPLRKWMEARGAKGLALKTLSHLQIAGHWGLTIGPYTYDIFQYRREVKFHHGEWRMKAPGEKSRVKVKTVGFTYMTDMQIYETAKAVYERMRPLGYDHSFNNCHRFANDLAERISTRDDLERITLRMRLLYIWNTLPASHIFHAGEFTKQLVRLPKQVLLERLMDELRIYGIFDSEFWRALRHSWRITAKAIFFLLTVGGMTVFLQMARSLTRWDPDDPKDRVQYLSLFDSVPGISHEMSRTYLICAFQGPKALSSMTDSLFYASGGGSKGFLRASFRRLRDVIP